MHLVRKQSTSAHRRHRGDSDGARDDPQPGQRFSKHSRTLEATAQDRSLAAGLCRPDGVRDDASMGGGDLPGGVYVAIDGRVHAARHVRGQPYVTLIDDGARVIELASADRLFRRTVSGLSLIHI